MSNQPEQFKSIEELMASWTQEVIESDLDPIIMISLNSEGTAVIQSTMPHDSEQLLSILEQIVNISRIKKQFKEKGPNYES